MQELGGGGGGEGKEGSGLNQGQGEENLGRGAGRPALEAKPVVLSGYRRLAMADTFCLNTVTTPTKHFIVFVLCRVLLTTMLRQQQRRK